MSSHEMFRHLIYHEAEKQELFWHGHGIRSSC
jgi:hypothetical protein